MRGDIIHLLLFSIFVAGCIQIGTSPGHETNRQVEPGTVYITSSGFFPKTITISVGDKVTWINKDTAPHWIASDVHPVHTAYPGANYDEPGSYEGSRACKGEGQPKSGAFDACRSIAPGENYSFTFNQTGTLFYHDHLNYYLIGSVIVKGAE